ncbi:MAG: hypothetical protein KDI68_02085 [Gammaproteobacteria bacterium]|nr:hypothetical protein [Gammaproteobacteria bacterium]
MRNNNDKPIQVSDRALEMVMRDVLDGMLELSLDSAFRSDYSDFEIVEIYSDRDGNRVTPTQTPSMNKAEVLPFPQLRKAAC